MATLQDDFLNDLDDLDSDGEGSNDEEEMNDTKTSSSSSSTKKAINDENNGDDSNPNNNNNNNPMTDGSESDDDDDEDSDVYKLKFVVPPTDKTLDPTSLSYLHSQNILLRSPAFQTHLQTTNSYVPPPPGSTEADRLYPLLQKSNRYIPVINNEISNAYSFLLHLYSSRFPDLDTLVNSASLYCRVVHLIGNCEASSFPLLVKTLVKPTDAITLSACLTAASKELQVFLSNSQILTLTVSASMSPGESLSPEIFATVIKATEELESLIALKSKIHTSIESSMSRIAPNVTALVGSSVAASLCVLAGGLDALSRVPSCNIQAFGQSDSAATGLTSASRNNSGYTIGTGGDDNEKHCSGVLKYCDLVKLAKRSNKRKAIQVVAGKVSLCARCDAVSKVNSSLHTLGVLSSGTGEKFYEECKKKIVSWESLDKGGTAKSLPKPDMATKKKRGGKKARALKARFQETEVHKLANKRSMTGSGGSSEYGDDAMGMDMGFLGSGQGGGVRGVEAKQKAKLSMSKQALKRRGGVGGFSGAAGGLQAVSGAGGGGSGFASSVVFDSKQGLELVDPAGAKRRKLEEANKKFFEMKTGMASALPK